MKKHISYEKKKKKKKKEINSKKRADWGKLNPVTKVKKSKKVYDRKKAHYRDDDFDNVSFIFI